MSTGYRTVAVSPYQMSTAELIDEAARRRAAGEEDHADELLRFAVARDRAVAAHPDLPVQEAMRRHREVAP